MFKYYSTEKTIAKTKTSHGSKPLKGLMAKELVKKSNDNARTTLDTLKGLGKTVDDITKKKGRNFQYCTCMNHQVSPRKRIWLYSIRLHVN